MISIESLGQGASMILTAGTGLSQQKISMGRQAASFPPPSRRMARRGDGDEAGDWLGAIFAVSKNWE